MPFTALQAVAEVRAAVGLALQTSRGRAGRCVSRKSLSAYAAAGQHKVWRPSLDDVQRISTGDAAKHRGTGSRAVPHRLNAEERKQYERAKQSGLLALAGSGYRRERKGSPLANIWRQWCDAKAQPCVLLAKGGNGTDTVLVDLSTLRLPELESAQHRAACFSIAQQHRCSPLQEELQQSPFTVILPPQLVTAMLDGSTGAGTGGNGSSAGGTQLDSTGTAAAEAAAAAVTLAAEAGVGRVGSAQDAAASLLTASNGSSSGISIAVGSSSDSTTAVGSSSGSSSVDALLEDLRVAAPIWQQPPQLQCFAAERSTAKALAKQLAAELGSARQR